ncbi:hypothetical protein [Demequina sp. NBRC 110053]|uniref:hypothetical protein n=1 Tax=Demequina sp. NBRC 110053 TaxID=1570342 RepID=UPI000A063ED2|nr:hypothetical protein [Demequina sp. NBRC 110053]
MTFAADLDSRTYFRTLDAALADLGLPLGAVDKVRAAVTRIDFEHVSIPDSREHIALELPGETKPVGYITSTFVALHPRGGASEFIEIAQPRLAQPETEAATADEPTRASARRQPSSRAASKPAEPTVQPCPTCYTGLPLSGVCDWCG